MPFMFNHQRTAAAAIVAASLIVLTGCARAAHQVSTSSTGAVTTSAAPSTSASTISQPVFASGTVLISNGTPTVVIGGARVTFPTSVTDAAWSPDGSRIVFVDADGNISTTHPDGSSRIVLTSKSGSLTRSRPTWLAENIVFAEKTSSGKTTLRSVFTNGGTSQWAGGETDAEMGEDAPEQGNSAPSATNGSTARDSMAYQHAGSKGPEVWVTDLNQREPYSSKVANGTGPAISPDGSKIAYVATNGQISVVTHGVDPGKPKQITFGASKPTHLSWSPDGAKVSFETSTEVDSVSASVSGGATSNAVTKLASGAGVATYLSPARDRVIRITGSDPVAISIAASKFRWPTMQDYYGSQDTRPAQGAVIASANDAPDALAASQLAASAHGPLLFTTGSSLDSRTNAEIVRVLGHYSGGLDSAPIVTIIGGTSAVPASVEAAISAHGYAVRRIDAANPIAAAVAAANQVSVPGNALGVIVASASDPVAEATAEAAAGYGTAVLLTDGRTVPADVMTYLNGITSNTRVYALGADAQAAMATSWSGKPSGFKASRVTTLAGSPRDAILVNPASPAEAVIGVAMAQGTGGGLLEADGSGGLGSGGVAWLDASSGSVDTALLIGSWPTGANGATKIGGLIDGPLGYTTAENTQAPKIG